MSEIISTQNNTKDGIPSIQRAVVFQGGGSLGAYEAGVFNTLSKKISHIDYNSKKHLFDIIIGTSIGAVNGAILISSFLKTNNWVKSGERLEEFWNSVKTESMVEKTPGFIRWWDYWNKMSNGETASGEAARRYYSARQFLTNGVPHMFSSHLQNDEKFMESFNVQYRTNNNILGNFLDEEFIDFPITTSYDSKEPRFLLTTIDVKSGDVVTFDSYNTKTSYGNDLEIVIEYPKGIEKKHLMSSASLPQNSKHHKIKDVDGKTRIFWDGSFLSNTPLREMIHHHRHYWHKVRKSQKIPDLEIFIVGL